jgi:predicted oxidoreductase
MSAVAGSLRTTRADVLIVGCGGAGVGAAIEVAARGASVIVFDSHTTFGGAAAVSGGGCCIAGSPLQERWGLKDSPEFALEDWLAWGGPSVDVDWARRYLEASVPELYVWLAEQGVEWIDLHEEEGNRVLRWHAPREAGMGVLSAMWKTANAYPIDWRFEHQVTDLIVEAGRVTGLVAVGPTGPAEFRGEAILVAAGGFNNNPQMIERYAPPQAVGRARILCGGGVNATGRGHRLLETVHAQFTQMDALWMYPYGTPDYLDPTGQRGLVVRGLEGDIWVNRHGRRFHDESKRGGATGTPAILAQDPPTCWSVIDTAIAARCSVADPQYREKGQPIRARVQALLDESPYIAKGNTLTELAERAGIDRAALAGTVAGHNRTLALGLERDPDFGRPLMGLKPLEQPPFYAIQFFPLARKNLGGARTNLDCQVLDARDRPIPGLFAAGEVAGMAGGRINGRAGLEGTMFGPSIYSGRVAGRAMVGARVG